jgi:hypothetical protein
MILFNGTVQDIVQLDTLMMKSILGKAKGIGRLAA